MMSLLSRDTRERIGTRLICLWPKQTPDSTSRHRNGMKAACTSTSRSVAISRRELRGVRSEAPARSRRRRRREGRKWEGAVPPRRRLSIFGHVWRLPEATPAHSARRLAVNARTGIKPDIRPEWKRQRGRPCRM